VFRRVLVILGGGSEAQVLEHAVAVAQLGRARLTLACLPARPPLLAFLAPIAFRQSSRELEDEAAARLRRAAGTVPRDIPVLKLLLTGGRAALTRELDRGGYDLVVTGQRTRRGALRPAAGGLLGPRGMETSVLRVRC
jgi:hypothetical protein